MCLGHWLYTLLYPVGAPLHSKGQKQAAKDVTTATVNLVSIIHVTICVSAASILLTTYHPPSQSDHMPDVTHSGATEPTVSEAESKTKRFPIGHHHCHMRSTQPQIGCTQQMHALLGAMQ